MRPDPVPLAMACRSQSRRPQSHAVSPRFPWCSWALGIARARTASGGGGDDGRRPRAPRSPRSLAPGVAARLVVGARGGWRRSRGLSTRTVRSCARVRGLEVAPGAGRLLSWGQRRGAALRPARVASSAPPEFPRHEANFCEHRTRHREVRSIRGVGGRGRHNNPVSELGRQRQLRN